MVSLGPMSDSPARSFGSVVDAYDRGRPSYPAEAAAWLVGAEAVSVLELGAGTGKLTAVLDELGHEVYASEPDEAMLAVLKRDLPDVPTSVCGAEEIPAPDGAFDVVVCAQAFHWFDHDRALPEIARVLGSGGRLALVWNERDESIPWVRKLGRIIGTQEQDPDPGPILAASGLFGEVETTTFTNWQLVDRESILDLVRSRSNVAVLDDEARERLLADVRAFYDDYGRGMDGMQLPYVVRCYRASVLGTPAEAPVAESDAGPSATPDSPSGGSSDGPSDRPSDGTDTDLLLIDFR